MAFALLAGTLLLPAAPAAAAIHRKIASLALVTNLLLSSLPHQAPTAFGAAAAAAFRSHRPFEYRQRRYSPSSSSSSNTPRRTTTATMLASVKLESPSAERNKDPIYAVLDEKVFTPYYYANTPKKGEISAGGNRHPPPIQILEIAGGSGVHMQYIALKLAKANRPFKWHPTDADERSLASQRAYVDEKADKLAEHVSEPCKLTLSASGIVSAEAPAPAEAESPAEAGGADKKKGSKGDDNTAIVPNSSMDLLININMIHISPWDATLGLMKVARQKLKYGGILYLYGPYKVGGTCVDSNKQFDLSLKDKNPEYGVRDLESVVSAANEQGLNLMEVIEMPANNLSVLFRKEQQ